MAQDKVGDDAPDARKRELKTAPEFSDTPDEQFEPVKDTDSEPAADDAPIDESAAPDMPVEKTPRPAVLPPVMPKQSFFKRLLGWFGSHKKLSIPLAAVVVLGVLAAIPFTRYAIAGLVLKQTFTVSVVDAETKQPVTSAKVRIDGVETTTDNKGKASAKVAVGKAKVAVSKKYFKSAEQTVTVPILKQKDVPEVRLQATGRQVAVKVVNKINKKALGNATVVVADTEAKTDTDGTATLVIPAGENTVEATLKAAGYNDSKVSLQVMKGEADNTFTLTPAGKVYFLSNQSGKLDVVKTNLDGTDRQVVLAGTGREDKPSTSLLASRDWRYLALQSRRDSDKAKVYLIDTQTDKLSVVDEGDASFDLSGWSGHNLIYRVSRDNLQWNEAKRYALKTFNAEAQKLTTIDENTADGLYYERFESTYIRDNQVLYVKVWSGSGPNVNHQHTVNTVNPDGKNKKVIKSYDHIINDRYSNLSTRPYGPQGLYLMLDVFYGGNNTQYTFEEYDHGQIKPLQNYTNDQFWNTPYTTYLISPSGGRSFWSEDRDGAQTFFIGNKDAENEEKIATLPKYGAHGWYTDDYVLVAKEGSQLFIAPSGKLSGEGELTKVTDYYRPDRSYQGYGYGYGGL